MGWYKAYSSFLQDPLKKTFIDRYINCGHQKEIENCNVIDLLNEKNKICKIKKFIMKVAYDCEFQ